MKTKPIIFSKVFQFLFLIIVTALLAIILISVGVPKWIVFVIIIVLYIAYTVYWPAHIIYRSKSIKAINRYVKKNHGQPIFNYSYALGNGNDHDIEIALKRVMNTYGQEDMHDVYGAHLAIFQNNSKDILTHAENIKDTEYQNYFRAYAYLLKGHFADVAGYMDKLETPWMIHSLKAVTALKRRDMVVFRDEADKAIESALGIQRYTVHHTMRRLENNAN